MAIVKTESFDFQLGAPPEIRMWAADINARNAIPTVIRWEGMQVYCRAEKRQFQLRGNNLADNGNWVEMPTAEGFIQEIIFSVGDTPPGVDQGKEGDFYYRSVEEGTEVYQKDGGVWVSKGTISGGSGSGTPRKYSFEVTGVDTLTLNWSTVDPNMALPGGVTPAEFFGPFANIQVYQFSVYAGALPIEINKSGSTVVGYNIPLAELASEIFIS